ncbi:MAG: DUF4998 domain-containing protein [Dysgonamonadaceae bacterium]|jgi:hypothetical protein|nr:DUF4998 domain-containing protein [Dysgonamonadaceae bacterium]
MKNKYYIAHYIMVALAILALSSCTGIFDSLKEYATEETVYPAGFDKIAGKIGFERVEIDLCSAGRVPSSQMKLSKAVRTIVECPDFDEPLVIDSVCSWVNITGLTEPKEYAFSIYTEDEYGDRSIAKEISLTPYTSSDLAQMELLSPKITESNSVALFEWQNKLSNISFDCYGYSYEYTDRNGAVHTGDGVGDMPCFFVENIAKGNTIPVKVTLRIVPKRNDISIIDTVKWQSVIPLIISESAEDVIFLKSPETDFIINMNDPSLQSYLFSWVQVEGITSYTLKISTSTDFPAGKTFEITSSSASVDVGISEIGSLVVDGSARCYWTVVPSLTTKPVNTQTRALNVYRPLIPTGMWLFDDPSDIFKASIGQAMIGEPSDNGIVTADGTSDTDKAVFVPERSYLTCIHGITPKAGNTYVNEYTVLMNIKLSSFRWFSIADINSSSWNGEWFISPAGELDINGGNFSVSAKMKENTWHRVIYSVKLDEYIKIYLDGQLIKTIGTNTDWKDGDYALRPELYLFKDDDSWNDANDCYVSGVVVWGLQLNDMEVGQLDNIVKPN